MNNIPNFGEYERFFKLKYGLFSTIELNYHFIKSNKKNQRGKDSIHWIAPYMDILLKYSKECSHITEFGINQVNSTWAFLNSRPKKLISYDIDLHIKPTQYIPEFRNTNIWLIWAMILSYEENLNFTALQADTTKIDIEQTDLLFIDTNHTEEHLRLELRLHKKK